ncbi:MAG: hypothetical protein AAF490_15330 [Chloroflexota bacterium]
MLSDNFSMVDLIPERLMPSDVSLVIQSQAALIILLSFLFIGATLFLLFSWLISQDLQRETVVMSLVYIAFLGGVILLPQAGLTTLAGGLLITVLLATMIFMTVHYGVSSPSVTAFLIPIVLATIVVNTAVGLSVTLISIAVLWSLAFIELKGWWTPLLPVRRDNLTFKAPFFTVIFAVVFVTISGWTSFLVSSLG